MRLIGVTTLLIGTLAMIGELAGIAFPTARWFFEASRKFPWLNAGAGDFPWFGWVGSVIAVIFGVLVLIYTFTRGPANPMALRRIRRFREIKRGYYSLIILVGLLLLAMLDQVIVGNQALAVQHKGRWVFPAFVPGEMKYKDFDSTVGPAEGAVNFRKLKKAFAETGEGRVIMPLIPYAPTNDTLPPRSRAMVEREGVYHESGSGEPYFGLAARYTDVDESKMHIRYTMRKGKISGPVDGWDAEGNPVYSAEYLDGAMVSERYTGAGTKEDFMATPSSDIRAVKYHPAPSIPEDQNWLGTTSQGYDVVAYLYGGLQVNFKAAVIFLPIVYFIGISLGMMMGYLGGWFDLTLQRIIEIFSNMPFLFVVIIFSSMVPDRFKGLPVILTILIVFGWMGMTYLMRTAAYRDRERDYISAARVMGASPGRIIFRHLLPNTVAIIVTLIPFTMSGLIFSLTSLDYLGFGLPPEYATWGRLLNDGLSNLSAPWLVTSTFAVLVGLLVLITFVGEAVREAYDPKKFTYYR